MTLPDDFTDGAPLAIPLDPALSARDNAARFYKEHKRLSRALAGIDARLADANAQAASKLRARRLRAAGAQAAAAPAASSAGKRDERPPPYREFRSSTGAAILVGRGADRNDELTFKVARGNDLWLHTRDVPGAHVVVPLSGRPIDGETLLDAATLGRPPLERARRGAGRRRLRRAQARAQAAQVAPGHGHALGRQDRSACAWSRRASQRLLASRVDEDR